MINQEAFETFWYWINERHKIYIKKEAGEPKPWSDDPIFQTWRFCNVFRQLDTQSKYLIDNIIKPAENWDPAVLLFNIYAFRAFNWYPTYEAMGGYQFEWNERAVGKLLKAHAEKNKLTSGAYMIRGRQYMAKYNSILQTLTNIWKNSEFLIEHLTKYGRGSLEEYQKILMWMGFWGWGPFTTYQIVLDLTYSPILRGATDINTWCEFGPGAKRGIKLIYPELKNSEMLQATRGLLLDSPKFLEPHVPTMTLQDIEFSLCELGKYMRAKAGGKGKNHYDGI